MLGVIERLKEAHRSVRLSHHQSARRMVAGRSATFALTRIRGVCSPVRVKSVSGSNGYCGPRRWGLGTRLIILVDLTTLLFLGFLCVCDGCCDFGIAVFCLWVARLCTHCPSCFLPSCRFFLFCYQDAFSIICRSTMNTSSQDYSPESRLYSHSESAEQALRTASI